MIPTGVSNNVTYNQMYAALANYLPLAGGVVTGAIIETAPITIGAQLATKDYVDTHASSATLTAVAPLVNNSGALSLNPISDTNVASGAAIAVSKLAAMTVSQNVVTDVSGNLSTTSAQWINKAGDTITGDIIASANTSQTMGLVTKSYVDSKTAVTGSGSFVGGSNSQIAYPSVSASYSQLHWQTIPAGILNNAGDRIICRFLLSCQTTDFDNYGTVYIPPNTYDLHPYGQVPNTNKNYRIEVELMLDATGNLTAAYFYNTDDTYYETVGASVPGGYIINKIMAGGGQVVQSFPFDNTVTWYVFCNLRAVTTTSVAILNSSWEFKPATGVNGPVAGSSPITVTSGVISLSPISDNKIASGAAIAVSKLAAMTANLPVITDANGFLTTGSAFNVLWTNYAEVNSASGNDVSADGKTKPYATILGAITGKGLLTTQEIRILGAATYSGALTFGTGNIGGNISIAGEGFDQLINNTVSGAVKIEGGSGAVKISRIQFASSVYVNNATAQTNGSSMSFKDCYFSGGSTSNFPVLSDATPCLGFGTGGTSGIWGGGTLIFDNCQYYNNVRLGGTCAFNTYLYFSNSKGSLNIYMDVPNTNVYIDNVDTFVVVMTANCGGSTVYVRNARLVTISGHAAGSISVKNCTYCYVDYSTNNSGGEYLEIMQAQSRYSNHTYFPVNKTGTCPAYFTDYDYSLTGSTVTGLVTASSRMSVLPSTASSGQAVTGMSNDGNLIYGSVASGTITTTASYTDSLQEVGVKTDGTLVIRPNPLPTSTIISATITTPPNPSNPGDTYFVPTGATGVWLGQNNKLAVSDDGVSIWIFSIPSTTVNYTTSDTNITYNWNGTVWAPIAGGIYVSKLGDTMTGALVLPSDPVSNLQASTKQYVDNRVGSYVGNTRYLSYSNVSNPDNTYLVGIPGGTLINLGDMVEFTFDFYTMSGGSISLQFNSVQIVNLGVVNAISKVTMRIIKTTSTNAFCDYTYFVNGSGAGSNTSSTPINATFTPASLTYIILSMVGPAGTVTVHNSTWTYKPAQGSVSTGPVSYFARYNQSGQAIAASTNTLIGFGTVVEDQYGIYNTSTKVATVPYAGLWEMYCVVGTNTLAAVNYLQLNAQFNGAGADSIGFSATNASFFPVVNGKITKRFTVGQTMGIILYSFNAGNTNTGYVEFRWVGA